MKFVANLTFYNGPQLKIVLDKDQPIEVPEKYAHDNAIHKGARFSIGTSEKAEELSQEERLKVLWLANPSIAITGRCAVQATDKAVARIDREAKEEWAKRIKEDAPVPSMEALVGAAVAKALVAAGVVPVKKAA